MRLSISSDSVFFFFQAEDGIRDDLVTGVQTCALPILGLRSLCPRAGAPSRAPARTGRPGPGEGWRSPRGRARPRARSEERRVGKKWRYESARRYKKK